MEKRELASGVSTAADTAGRHAAESNIPKSAAASPPNIQLESGSRSCAAGHLIVAQAAGGIDGAGSAELEVPPTETADGDADSPTHVFPLASIAEETASPEREASRSTGQKQSDCAAASPSLLADDAALDVAIDAVLLAAKEEGKDPPDVPTFEAMEPLLPEPTALPLHREGSSEEAAAVVKPAVGSNAEAGSRYVAVPPALPAVPETGVLAEPALPLLTDSKPADEDYSAVQSAEKALAGLSLAGIAPTKPFIDPATAADSDTAADPEANHQLQAQQVNPAPAKTSEKRDASSEEEIKPADIGTKAVAGLEEEHLPTAEVNALSSAAQFDRVGDSELHSQSPDEPLQAGIAEDLQPLEEVLPLDNPGQDGSLEKNFASTLRSRSARSSEQHSDEPEPGSPQSKRENVLGPQQCDNSQAEGEAESSDEESYTVRPKVQAPGVFTSRLLAEYAAICTPVRSLPARQNGLQSSPAEDADDSPKKVVKPLALSLAEQDDLPNKGSPLGDG